MHSFNQAFSCSALARFLYPTDFYKDVNLADENYRNNLLQNSLKIANDNFSNGASYNYFYLSSKDASKDKKTYFSSNLEEKLVLRRCAYNIYKSLNIKPQNRNKICREIKSFLTEGSRYRIYKLDIKSFFESIQVQQIMNILNDKVEISTHTKNIVSSFLSYFGGYLPRGLEFSSTISEMILEDFDNYVKKNKEVLYYNRFVDDIFIITTSDEDSKVFYKNLQRALPENIVFNYNKKKIISVKARKKSAGNPNGTVVAKFTYLGYEFSVIDTQLLGDGRLDLAVFRKVVVEMSNKKKKSFKTKISKSFVSYNKTGDFELLKARLVFLTSNRDLLKKRTTYKIPTGIYYNFSLLTSGSKSLVELDHSLHNFILNYDQFFNKKNLHSLTWVQKRMLLKLSFKMGFEKRIYKKYSPNKLTEITMLWQ